MVRFLLSVRLVILPDRSYPLELPRLRLPDVTVSESRLPGRIIAVIGDNISLFSFTGADQETMQAVIEGKVRCYSGCVGFIIFHATGPICKRGFSPVGGGDGKPPGQIHQIPALSSSPADKRLPSKIRVR